MESQLQPVIQLLAEKAWPFRLHATYDETIKRALTVYEAIHAETPINHLHWFFDHAETISDKSIERVQKLGGGIAIQNRMAFQGEYFIKRYGIEKTQCTPPINKMLEAGIPVGLGTDATRVSSYNPWVCLYWLTTGKTVGGTTLYQKDNILSREKALELYTKGSAWFSKEEEKKGSFLPNQFADFAVLSKDFFSIPDEEIKNLYALMTIVGGKIVYACEKFATHNPPLPPVSPDWSPIKYYGTYGGNKSILMPYNVCKTSHYHSDHGPWEENCNCWAF
jgi:predicted amidohydrolase YtcJ